LALKWILSSNFNSTTATVDFIQVNTKMYSDGYYIGYIWNSANDASYTSKSVVGGYYGFIQAYGAHDAMDWTGNEATTTYDSLQL